MPARSSAAKRHAQSERNHERNKSYKSMLKTRTKTFLEAIASGKTDDARAQYRGLTGLLDKGVSKGIVHASTASRKKSRMSRALGRA